VVCGHHGPGSVWTSCKEASYGTTNDWEQRLSLRSSPCSGNHLRDMFCFFWSMDVRESSTGTGTVCNVYIIYIYIILYKGVTTYLRLSKFYSIHFYPQYSTIKFISNHEINSRRNWACCSERWLRGFSIGSRMFPLSSPMNWSWNLPKLWFANYIRWLFPVLPSTLTIFNVWRSHNF